MLEELDELELESLDELADDLSVEEELVDSELLEDPLDEAADFLPDSRLSAR